jgi:hypothetical protein
MNLSLYACISKLKNSFYIQAFKLLSPPASHKLYKGDLGVGILPIL